jgi:hypothetical protein
MSMTEARHKMYSFFDDLSQEQVLTLNNLVRAFANETQEAEFAKFIDGYLSGLAKGKFNICGGCGKNHDQQLEEMRNAADEAGIFKEQPMGDADKFSIPEDGPVTGDEQPVAPYVLTEDDLAHMEEYNLDDLRDEDPPHHLLGFMCKGCEMRYVSIADRMLRPPGIDGCSGCQLRSGHG